MSVSASQGISVRCNVCAKVGPIVRFDHTRYRHVPQQPNHPNETYIRQIVAQAEKEAFAEGFIPLIDLYQAPVPVAHDQDLEAAARDPEKLLKHICPVCVESFSSSVRKAARLRRKK